MGKIIAIMLVVLTGCGGTANSPDRRHPRMTLVTPTYEPGEWPRSKGEIGAAEAGGRVAAGGPIGPNAFDDGRRP